MLIKTSLRSRIREVLSAIACQEWYYDSFSSSGVYRNQLEGQILLVGEEWSGQGTKVLSVVVVALRDLITGENRVDTHAMVQVVSGTRLCYVVDVVVR